MKAAQLFSSYRSALLLLAAGLALSPMAIFDPVMAQRPLQIPAVSVLHQLQILESDNNTQLILKLNGSPQTLRVTDQPGQPMTVSFAASAKDLPMNRNFPWPNLKGVFAENRNGRVQIFIKRSMVGSVTISHSAHQMVLNVPHVFIPKNGNGNEISPGVQHTSFVEQLSSGPARVNILEIDPQNPSVDITPALAANRMGAKSNVANMVSGNQAIAGINGSFFKQDVGIPLGIIIINQELISGPIYDRVALGLTPTNEVVMDRIRLGGEVVMPDRRKVSVHTINQPRVKADQTVAYTTRWGKTAPKVPQNGLQILLRNDRVAGVSQNEALPIPKDGVVISGPATPDMLALANLGPNLPVSVNIYTIPDWSGMKHAIGGGPWLVKGGHPYVDLQAQHFTASSLGSREPRSAVGVTATGKMLLVTVDGRQKGISVGMTIYELSHLMKKLGAVNAMNLDGGSSTQMSVFGRTVNTPSAGSVGVSNSLLIKHSGDGSMAERFDTTRFSR
ncbi:phosphodiester glycosidase family protein [Vampirovibrio sp.]|uniref:phosphodiester glycosidase family protein n=1 Tax=Vampirovibrio sp. TaxID=2717857 RepID=UPI003592E944